MSYVYKNANTGDVVSRDERSSRFDALANWSLISQPAEPEPEVHSEPATTDDQGAGEPFDPAVHDVHQVLAHLETASHDEALRVLDAEAGPEGKQRKGILNNREDILARAEQTDEEGQ